MGEFGERGCLRQAKLGYTDHLCNMHHLPSGDMGHKCTAVEIPLLQKTTNTHSIPVNSRELKDMCIYV